MNNREEIRNREYERRIKAERRRRWIRCFNLVVIVLMGGIFFYLWDLNSQLKEIRSVLANVQEEQIAERQSAEDLRMEGTAGIGEDLRPGEDDESGEKNGKGSDKEYSEKRDSSREVDYISTIPVLDVGKPVKWTPKETLAKLKELGKANETILQIYKNHDSYPDALLLALANNPEMTDFAAGYLSHMEAHKAESELKRDAEKDSEKDHAGGGKTGSLLTEKEKEEAFPLFLQWDPRWGYEEYGNGANIGVSGCGPTCLSMVLFTLTRKENLTPDYFASYSMKNGYYVEDVGTAWALMEEAAPEYGITVQKPQMTKEVMEKALDQGKMLICAMREGDFTAGGHFIVIYGYDKSGFYVNDSNCVARSRRQWTFAEIGKQIKCIWAYGKTSGTMAAENNR